MSEDSIYCSVIAEYSPTKFPTSINVDTPSKIHTTTYTHKDNFSENYDDLPVNYKVSVLVPFFKNQNPAGNISTIFFLNLCCAGKTHILQILNMNGLKSNKHVP